MLKLQFADNRQSSFWIVDSQFGIGSAPKNQIVIKDEVILPFHAVIEQQGGHLMIRPAEPGALITINGEAVTDKAELKVNDRIALAGVELILVDPARNVARPMSPASPMAPRPAPARAETSQKWQITALTGPLANTRILIDGVKLVGRDPTADIQISGGHISRKHAEFLLREGQLWIRDLNSSNGTYVNQRKTNEQPLYLGDEIKFDAVLFRVTDGKAPPKQGGQVSSTDNMEKTQFRPVLTPAMQRGVPRSADPEAERRSRPGLSQTPVPAPAAPTPSAETTPAPQPAPAPSRPVPPAAKAGGFNPAIIIAVVVILVAMAAFLLIGGS